MLESLARTKEFRLEERHRQECRAGFRRLGPEDGARFVELLRAVYGDTYSYKALYEPRVFAKLVRDGTVHSFGVFNEHGELVGHTALLAKDEKHEYFESGITLRHPHRKSAGRRVEDELFDHLLPFAREHVHFIHQNTTTLHVFAQIGARRYFQAAPCGFLLRYAAREKLNAIDHADTAMSPLVYTTVLRPDGPSKLVILPAGPWGAWVRSIYEQLPAPRTIEYVECPNHQVDRIATRLVELNQALGLRRLVPEIGATQSESTSLSLASEDARGVLVHLPLTASHLKEHFHPLLNHGFYPVCIRPHARRHDELVFQRARPEVDLPQLRSARIRFDVERSFVTAWLELCQQTT